MGKKLDFSIVLPTYSGVETIGSTLDSILTQKTKSKYELVIVIDGPNKKLAEIAKEAKKRFEASGIPTKIKQFKTNKGRFVARIEGAKLAGADQLLFMDDRVEFGEGYLEQLMALRPKVAMPNVIEVEEKTRPISLTLRLVRKKLYGKKWGETFDDYYVDKTNFERSPKGAAALWISKRLFLDSCFAISKAPEKLSQYTNEDTRVLKMVVDSGEKILRSSKLIIYYHPRADFKSETRHLYARGPRFIDYYLRPGTRFFVPLLVFYAALITSVVSIILWPVLALKALGLILLAFVLFAGYLANFGPQIFMAFIGLVAITMAFGLGILKGTWIKYKSVRQNRVVKDL